MVCSKQVMSSAKSVSLFLLRLPTVLPAPIRGKHSSLMPQTCVALKASSALAVLLPDGLKEARTYKHNQIVVNLPDLPAHYRSARHRL